MRFDRDLADVECASDCLVRLPFRQQLEHALLAQRQVSGRVDRAFSHCLDDFGWNVRAARDDHLQGIDHDLPWRRLRYVCVGTADDDLMHDPRVVHRRDDYNRHHGCDLTDFFEARQARRAGQVQVKQHEVERPVGADGSQHVGLRRSLVNFGARACLRHHHPQRIAVQRVIVCDQHPLDDRSRVIAHSCAPVVARAGAAI